MPKTTPSRVLESDGSLANLEDLRQRLVGALALLLTGISALVAWLVLPQQPFPEFVFLFALVLLSWGGLIHFLNRRLPHLARHLLMWGCLAVLLLSMQVFVVPWLPFLGLLLSFAGATLIPGSEAIVSGAILALAAWLGRDGGRVYPLPELATALIAGAGLSWLVARAFYTALEWAWNMQQRADRLLEEARDHQAALARTLRTLEIFSHVLQRANRDLAAARQQAEEARRMKEQFAANVSHELRTPLNLILGFSEMMYLSPEVYGEMNWPPTLRQDVYQIYRNSRHLLEMIDDILDLSRFEITGFSLHREPTDMEHLLRSAAEIAADLFRNRAVSLEVAIEPGLPVLQVDRTRIRQVVLNLLSNAQRFTKEGKVRLEAKRVDDELVVSVSDTGPGIPADRLPYIFDEFYQVDGSLRRSHGGVGLGLAISKRFVQAHDGRIWVESQEGKGSTFFFSLPLPGYLPISHLHLTTPVAEEGYERPCILVCDPDPAVAALIRRHLEGYDIIQIENAEALEEQVALHRPQVVIYNTTASSESRTTSLSPLVPVITCSLPSQAWASDDLRVLACLTKPITTEQLLRALEPLGEIRDILVVDDDRGFCQLMERSLAAIGRGLSVRHAYDGKEGIQAMQERRPDLVLLDLIMPEEDGFWMLARMHQDPTLSSVPCIVLTASSYGEDAMHQHGSQIVIQRQGGLRPQEVLRCLQALIPVLKPVYS